MIVIDTNILVHLTIESELTASARELVREHEVHAPRFWRSEYMNVLATEIRHKSLPLADALSLVVRCQSLINGNEHETDSKSVLSLAQGSGCTSYDCEFVATAVDLGVPLVTLDKKLLSAFPEVARSLESMVGEGSQAP